MAAEYPLGVNNIVYKAKEFQTGLAVTCKLRDPDLELVGEFELIELDDGLYFFVFDFEELGIYCAVFFEEAVPSQFSAFRVVYRTFRSF